MIEETFHPVVASLLFYIWETSQILSVSILESQVPNIIGKPRLAISIIKFSSSASSIALILGWLNKVFFPSKCSWPATFPFIPLAFFFSMSICEFPKLLLQNVLQLYLFDIPPILHAFFLHLSIKNTLRVWPFTFGLEVIFYPFVN